MKKSVGQEKVITNYDAGGIVEKFEVSEEINGLSLKACDILELDYAGIDIIFENNQPLILEVNPAAQFEGFENATGLNVAREILKFIIEK
jgi:glutathione synthase/RimK-type ligase-like ATP-grasp enzyme